MPTYEVRRRTVLAYCTVTAANETEARTLARDVFQQDAAIAALAADVIRRPNLEPYDQERDNMDAARYDWNDHDTETEKRRDGRSRLFGAESDSKELEPW